MKTIRARLAVLVATAAIAPLLAYGVVSLQLLRSATNVSVTGEAETAAEHAAAEIDHYLAHNIDLLTSVASDLQYAKLTLDQQERILRNNIQEFTAYGELTLFDGNGVALASTQLLEPTLVLGAERPTARRPRIAPIQIDAAQLPSTEISLLTRSRRAARRLPGGSPEPRGAVARGRQGAGRRPRPRGAGRRDRAAAGARRSRHARERGPR